MMSLLRTARILTRNTISIRKQAAAASAVIPKCYFSAEPQANNNDDVPLIPGIGRGKTSTGL
eukprot:scaffold243532_cov17-Cyclotella_meneghiniana.AAC.1